MAAPVIPAVQQPIYPAFEPQLDVAANCPVVNGPYEDMYRRLGKVRAERREDFAPYKTHLPLIRDIDVTIGGVLEEIHGGTCTLVGLSDYDHHFYTETHAPRPNRRHEAPERHSSSLCGGTLHIYRKLHCPLSNTFPAGVHWQNWTYPDVVTCVQAMKAWHFDDEDALEDIRSSTSAKDAADIAKKIKGFSQRRWDRHSIEYMVVAMYGKFNQNPHLIPYISEAVEDSVFVDGTSMSRIWSTGCIKHHVMNSQDSRTYNNHEWAGLNVCGRIMRQLKKYYTPNY